MSFAVKVSDDCTGCGTCVSICPVAVFELENEKAKVVREEECLGCMACVESCSSKAITVTEA